MTPLNTQPPQDALLVRYRAAVAELESGLETDSAQHDEPSGPSAQVRAKILAYAQQLANAGADTDTGAGVTHVAPIAGHLNDTKLIAIDSISTSGKELFSYSKTSSNDGQWKIRALASVAIFGLTGLLFMQWDSAPPEQKEIALSAPTPPPAHATDAAKVARPSTNEAAVQFEAGSAAPMAATAPAPIAAPALRTAPAPVAAPALRTAPTPLSTTATPASGETAQNTQTASQSGTEVLPAAQRSKKDNPRIAGERSAEAASVQLETVAGGLQADQSAASAQSAKRTAPAPTARMQPQPADAEALSAAPAASFAPAPAPAPAPAAESKSRAARSDKLASADAAAADLFAAIRQKDLVALQRALSQGASKDAKNNGTPAITLCVLAGQIDMVRTLAAQGANVNAVDAQGISPLAHARTGGHNDIAALLISLGAQ